MHIPRAAYAGLHSDSTSDEEIEPIEDFHTIYRRLCHAWLLLELKHRISKEGSAALWELAKKEFFLMYHARNVQQIRKQIPQFRSIRTKLYQDNVPEIKLELAYQCRESGEIFIAENQLTTPKSRYPPDRYDQLFEIASVEVRVNLFKCMSFFSK